jgi:predicted phosphodiesterase
MQVIKADLPRSIEVLELHIFADEHIGDDCCDLPRLKARIDYVASNPNAYCIMNGDILDYASRSSIGDIETREFNIMGQLEKAVELFAPIKDKILAITSGNHEGRSYRKEGIDISKMIAMQLGLADKYSPTSAILFLRFGASAKNQGKNRGHETQLYTVYVLHGSGGGRKEGAKAIRLADMASIIDADVYIHSHTHLPMVMKQGFFRVDSRSSSVSNATKLFVNTAANLNYGGYGEAAEFKPTSKDTPVIYLKGPKKEMWAKL